MTMSQKLQPNRRLNRLAACLANGTRSSPRAAHR